MSKLKEKIFIVGKSASGKDYLRNFLIKNNLLQDVMYTTRPLRDKEVNGIDYHFIDEKTFKDMILKEEFMEWDQFIGWYYGSTKKNFIESDLFIKTPRAISKILPKDRQNCFVIWLDPPDEVIESRLSKRNDSNDSLKRRMDTDKEDFKNFSDYDLRITDADYDPEFILYLIKSVE